MDIRWIELDDDENPERIGVEMSRDEAAFIVRAIGKHNGITADEIMKGGDELSTEIYNALTGSVFNRFYHGGIDDV